MALIADILLAAGALGVALYCFILSRRLRRFNDLEKGVGGAVAVLSTQVDDLTKTLKTAQATATNSSRHLEDVTERGEGVARRLEVLIASLHDLEKETVQNATAESDADASAEPVTSDEDTQDRLLFSSRRQTDEAA